MGQFIQFLCQSGNPLGEFLTALVKYLSNADDKISDL